MGFERGVSGYMLHTVPAALFCWLKRPDDVAGCVEEVILLGGDADSTGAIVGALSGATAGASAIPPAWLDGIVDWPRSVEWLRSLGARLSERFGATRPSVDRGFGGVAGLAPAEPPSVDRAPAAEAGPLRLFWPAIPARNLLFLAVALAHGFRRMLPPY
jgi:hypothetical protein